MKRKKFTAVMIAAMIGVSAFPFKIPSGNSRLFNSWDESV